MAEKEPSTTSSATDQQNSNPLAVSILGSPNVDDQVRENDDTNSNRAIQHCSPVPHLPQLEVDVEVFKTFLTDFFNVYKLARHRTTAALVSARVINEYQLEKLTDMNVPLETFSSQFITIVRSGGLTRIIDTLKKDDSLAFKKLVQDMEEERGNYSIYMHMYTCIC